MLTKLKYLLLFLFILEYSVSIEDQMIGLYMYVSRDQNLCII